MPDAAFKPGTKGFETVQAFQRAVGDDQATAAMLHDAAAASLRQSAMRPEGTLDPVRFDAWRQRFGDALRALPEGIGARFDDAARATESIEHVAAIRRDALEAYQRNAIGRLIDAQHPEDVTKAVGTIFSGKNPVGTMRSIAVETAKDPAAREGLRKAVGDYLTGRFI